MAVFTQSAQAQTLMDRIKERRAERIEAREQRNHKQEQASDKTASQHSEKAERRSLSVAGQTRYYDLVTSFKQTAPVLFFFHGGYASAEQMRKSIAFDALAANAGWHMVFAQASHKHWNDGRETAGSGSDDVAYFNAILDQLIASGVADPKRIAVIGISNGGMMVQRLAVEDSKARIFAAVSVAASLPKKLNTAGARAHNMLIIQGDKDTTVPINGGAVKSPDGGEVLGMPATLGFWQSLLPSATVTGHVVVDEGHDWPGRKGRGWQASPYIAQWLKTLF